MAKQVVNIGSAPGDASADGIRTGGDKINDNFTELYGYREHNVLDYGALGNSHYYDGGGQNDAPMFQTAVNEATAAGGRGVVVVPGNRTYRFNDPVVVAGGVTIVGLGGKDGQTQETPPTIVWQGSGADGPFLVTTASSNLGNLRVQNLTIAGAPPLTKPAYGIKFTATTPATGGKLDSGTAIVECFFRLINGNAIHFDNAGSTNFYLFGGRFDSIYGGYGIYINLQGSTRQFIGSIFSPTYVGGGSGQGKGFLHLDGENATAFGTSYTTIVGFHSEINQDLTETFASGTNPYDRQGIIRCGMSPALSNVQHSLWISGWHNSYPPGIKSHCAFHLTAASGTDADGARGLSVVMHGAHALSENNTESGATNQVRVFGGKVPTAMRYPFFGYRHGTITWGTGKDNTNEMLGDFIYREHGMYKVRGLGIKTETALTVAPPGGPGSLAVVTDATTTAKGAYTPGGSNTVLLMYNGSAWVIV